MSIEVNLFHPKINSVLPLDSGSLVVKIGDTEEQGKSEVSLFFMKNSDLAVRVLNLTPASPVEQISNFITDLLHHAGFTYYEYERSTLRDTPDVLALHPSDPERVPDEIRWIQGSGFVTIYQ
jgi:hypothetical protein